MEDPPSTESPAGSDPDAAAVAAGFDWLALGEDESVLWADTPHEMSLVPAFVVGIPLSLVLVGIPILVGAYLSHRNTNYVVSTAALYVKTGILSRNVQRIEFDKVQDTSYRQSFFGAQFGYGTVSVEAAGGGEVAFRHIENPREVRALVDRRAELSADPIPGTVEQWEAVLTEIRAVRAALAR
ncbi:MAG: PH domain-containing protein [Haloarculaceae archaeon]